MPVEPQDPLTRARLSASIDVFEAFEAVRLAPLVDLASLQVAQDVFVADLACYPPSLRACWAKIAYLCAGFPEGVTLYRGLCEDAWHPVGYAAWHPFQVALLDHPWPAIVPIDRAGGGTYLFNYSVVPSLIGSPLAATLTRQLDGELPERTYLAADTVSEHGRRVARRWGMAPHERRIVDGASWELWVRRG